MKIVIVDYGIGNVKSISNALSYQCGKPVLSRDRSVIMDADGLILPGVGAYSHGMNNLHRYGLIPVIKDYAETGKPLLGICLGMQMLLDGSEEFGETDGLGLITGKVVKLPIKKSNKMKLPHISWNKIRQKNIKWENTILDRIDLLSHMYFVHSFVAK
ncbi:imidazole glycerol phosphate synthase subunit HisH, partial [Akkermansiaceae bacterium]|nr:imidazole glycerol phosphate synthase subunit HisH [Akkermansiaceae bacterium]